MIVGILDFIKTGALGRVRIGQRADEVEKIFPAPDCKDRMGKDAWIWSYGTFEFHFNEGQLTLLWCDNFPLLPTEKNQFRWDLWILNKYRRLTLDRFLDSLYRKKIPCALYGWFSERNESGLPDSVRVDIAGTCVSIHFEDDATSFFDYKIVAIGASEMKTIDNTRALRDRAFRHQPADL
jgi:hypothetical protein